MYKVIFFCAFVFTSIISSAQTIEQVEKNKITLPNGWGITPIGRNFPLGDLPLNLVVSKSAKLMAAIKDGTKTDITAGTIANNMATSLLSDKAATAALGGVSGVLSSARYTGQAIAYAAQEAAKAKALADADAAAAGGAPLAGGAAFAFGSTAAGAASAGAASTSGGVFQSTILY